MTSNTYQINAGATDGYWKNSDPKCTLNYVSMGAYAGTPHDGVWYFVLSGDTPPQGATIDLAKIILYRNSSSGDAHGDFYGEDEDSGQNCPAENPETRSLTTAFVNGDNPCTGAGWNEHIITSIIQEIVNRATYVQGNPITIVWIQDGTTPEGWHRCHTYENDITLCAKLYIEWTVAPPPAVGGETKTNLVLVLSL